MDKPKSRKRIRRYYGTAKRFIKVMIAVVAPKLMKNLHATVEPYTPKHETFIIIGNHTDIYDPGYQMVALNRYIRFVAADFLLRLNPIAKFLLGTLEGVIVKERNKSSDMLVEEILENVKADIPVGLHAEGMVTTNGETGYISPNTGKLVKDSGVALITFRTVGGYLRKPRWAHVGRNGPVHGKVVNEYSPEELSKYSVDEINEIIKRDIYVNAYEEQRKNPHTYSGEKLAEYAERLLYVCPKCHQVDTLHSKDDEFTCECGYTLTQGEDAFWHSDKNEVVFDNVLDWDKWQRKEWKNILLSADDGVILSEEEQTVSTVINNEPHTLSEHTTINLYKDRFELVEEENTIILKLDKLKRVQNASTQDLVIIDGDSTYYLLSSKRPRSSDKYVAAWYYLTGRDYK